MLHKQITLHDIANFLGQTPPEHNAIFSGLQIDSRKIQKGEIFCALPGQHVHGKTFANAAIQAGASAVLAEEKIEEVFTLQVPNVEKAMWSIADFCRQQYSGQLIAITGSAGKTTIKEFTAHILKNLGRRVVYSIGSQNNQLGLPMTLSRLSQGDIAVVEIGASGVGEVEKLSALARPTIATVTTVLGAHLEKWGSIEAIAQSKAAIFASMEKTGTAVLVTENPFFAELSQAAEHLRLVTIGKTSKYLRNVGEFIKEDGKQVLLIKNYEESPANFALTLKGKHGLYNSMVAIALVAAVGYDPYEIARHVDGFKAPQGRMEEIQSKNYLIVHDAYNGNPSSLLALVETYQKKSPLVLFLGELAELGEEGEKKYRQVLQDPVFAACTVIVAIGEQAKMYTKHFSPVLAFQDVTTLCQELATDPSWLPVGATILLKGSRVAALERLLPSLLVLS